MSNPVILVDIIKEVVSSMFNGTKNVHFEPGRSAHIMKELNYLDNSITYKNKKYPLIAMVMPAKEVISENGYYSRVTIERIFIATITTPTDSVLKRYEDGGTFKSVLYPCYYEFLNRLVQHKNVVWSDPTSIPHTKMDVPGVHPIGQGTTDFIDSIDIVNLEITLSQIKNCK